MVADIIYSLFNLLGGLAVFMYGMKVMSDNLERVAGRKIKAMMSKVSGNKLVGVGIGTAVTAIIQSSAATTVMIVGFVNIGIITLMQAVPVIIGANIGTTVTLQITSLKNIFNITAIAGFFAAAGLFMNMFSRKNAIKRSGAILIGLGMIFIGLDFMSSSMGIFKEPLAHFFAVINNPILLMLFGMIFTAVIQSSSATTVIVAGFAAAGSMSLEAAVYSVLGMNIGTCVTALFSSIGTNINARRAAVIHLLFNVLGAIMVAAAFALIGFGAVEAALRAVSGLDIMRQIANFHTLFNVFTTILLLPLSGVLVKLSQLIVKGSEKKTESFRMYYFDERVLKTPPVAVSQLKDELLNMLSLAKRNLDLSIEALSTLNLDHDGEVMRREDEINFLNNAITNYLVQLSSLDLSYEDEKIVGSFFNAVTDIERIGDHAENVQKFVRKMNDEKIEFSDEAKQEIRDYADILNKMFEYVVKVFHDRQIELIPQVNKFEEFADSFKHQMTRAHIERLNNGTCTAESGAIYLSLASNFERVADHLLNISESVLTYVKKPDLKKKPSPKPAS